MGSSYCLSSDKKAIQNELTVINAHEENLEEKKPPPSANQYLNVLMDKKNNNNNNNNSNNKNDNHSNITNLTKDNHFGYSSQINNNKKEKNKNSESIVSNTFISKNVVALNNDVLISGNEVNPEKIYIKKKLLGSGAFGEVWLVRHKDLERDFAMKIIKKRKNKSSEEKEILNEIGILKKLDHPKILKIIDFYSKVKKYYINL